MSIKDRKELEATREKLSWLEKEYEAAKLRPIENSTVRDPRDGKLAVEKLVDLSHHDYRLEPNVFFSPDGQWIVFRSNMHGATHVYAVSVR